MLLDSKGHQGGGVTHGCICLNIKYVYGQDVDKLTKLGVIFFLKCTTTQNLVECN